jgi:predicted O-linked N-acetylglucosamine transferase (SPINDLY family)
MAGVPMVTLMGKTMVSRMAASMLSALGMQGLIAQSAQDYEDKINQWVASPSQLKHLRQQLTTSLKKHHGSAHQIAKGLEQGWKKMLRQLGKAA